MNLSEEERLYNIGVESADSLFDREMFEIKFVILKYYDYEGNYEVFEGTKEECKKFLSKVKKKDLDNYTIYLRGPTVQEFLK